MVNTPAFDLIRQFKEVHPETERLVLRRLKTKLTQTEIFEAFEKGVAGDYGKFIAADPQTLISWGNKYLSEKDSSKNYLDSGLIPVDIKYTDRRYPLDADEWKKEVNKCYHAFLKGVSSEYFHPLCYTQMQFDDKIALNEYMKETKSEELPQIHRAQQKIMAEKFAQYKKLGYENVYLISND